MGGGRGEGEHTTPWGSTDIYMYGNSVLTESYRGALYSYITMYAHICACVVSVFGMCMCVCMYACVCVCVVSVFGVYVCVFEREKEKDWERRVH